MVVSNPRRLPKYAGQAFTVVEYHRMIQTGLVSANDRVELLNGAIVEQMTRNPPHDSTLQRTWKRLFRILDPRWDVRVRCAITLDESEPEPDIAVVVLADEDYSSRHPGGADLGLVIEVADPSLAFDRQVKASIYAQNGIVGYWIINIPDEQIEVHSEPSGPAASPRYARQQVFRRGDSIPLILAGQVVAMIPAGELLP